MVYKDRQEVPVKELVAKLKVSEQVLGAYLAAAQRSTTIYSDLRQAGYSDEDLPAWFARPKLPAYAQEPPQAPVVPAQATGAGLPVPPEGAVVPPQATDTTTPAPPTATGATAPPIAGAEKKEPQGTSMVTAPKEGGKDCSAFYNEERQRSEC